MYKYEYGEDGKMDNYVMFTLSKSPEKNWIDSGQVRPSFIKIIFSKILFPTDPKLVGLDSDSVIFMIQLY